MLEKLKIKKRDLNLAKSKGQSVVDSIIENCKARHRVKRDMSYLRYKKTFQTCSIFSLFAFIIATYLVIDMIYVRFDKYSLEEIKTMSLITYAIAMTICFIPYFPLHVMVIARSVVCKHLFSKMLYKKFVNKMKRVIYMCHHHSNMMLVAKNNVQLEYYTETSLLFSRKALLKLLKVTNIFIREKYYDSLNFKYKRKFANDVEYYIKELNGCLIMNYKGKVPKYVTDAFEQVAMNLVELRKREARL